MRKKIFADDFKATKAFQRNVHHNFKFLIKFTIKKAP